MKTITETKTTIDFDIDNCQSEAVIENGVLKSVRIGIKGDMTNDLVATDEQFVRDVLKALQGLIHHLDKDRGLDRGFHPSQTPDIEFYKDRKITIQSPPPAEMPDVTVEYEEPLYVREDYALVNKDGEVKGKL